MGSVVSELARRLPGTPVHARARTGRDILCMVKQKSNRLPVRSVYYTPTRNDFITPPHYTCTLIQISEPTSGIYII